MNSSLPGDEERLRALLDDAVSDIEPRPALDDIRTRTKVTPMTSRRSWLYAALGGVAATAATVTAVVVLSDDGGTPSGTPAASTTTSATPDGSGSPSPTGTPTGTPTSVAVPVYYVGDTNTGPRLFREFHRLTTAAPAQSALTEALTSSALDPDYYSPWADLQASLRSVDLAAGTITIDLGGAALRDRPAGMSAAEASIAVEQLLYTAQASYQDRAPVQLLLDGGHSDTVLGVPAAEPLAEGDPMDVLGTVWITSPQDGDTVDGTFTVEGRGAFFEANVSWQLLQGGTVVKKGFAMAKECCTLSPYTFTVKGVPAGNYVLRVYDADMSGGEGNGEAEDTKRITVR